MMSRIDTNHGHTPFQNTPGTDNNSFRQAPFTLGSASSERGPATLVASAAGGAEGFNPLPTIWLLMTGAAGAAKFILEQGADIIQSAPLLRRPSAPVVNPAQRGLDGTFNREGLERLLEQTGSRTGPTPPPSPPPQRPQPPGKPPVPAPVPVPVAEPSRPSRLGSQRADLSPAANPAQFQELHQLLEHTLTGTREYNAVMTTLALAYYVKGSASGEFHVERMHGLRPAEAMALLQALERGGRLIQSADNILGSNGIGRESFALREENIRQLGLSPEQRAAEAARATQARPQTLPETGPREGPDPAQVAKEWVRRFNTERSDPFDGRDNGTKRRDFLEQVERESGAYVRLLVESALRTFQPGPTHGINTTPVTGSADSASPPSFPGDWTPGEQAKLATAYAYYMEALGPSDPLTGAGFVELMREVIAEMRGPVDLPDMAMMLFGPPSPRDPAAFEATIKAARDYLKDPGFIRMFADVINTSQFDGRVDTIPTEDDVYLVYRDALRDGYYVSVSDELQFFDARLEQPYEAYVDRYPGTSPMGKDAWLVHMHGLHLEHQQQSAADGVSAWGLVDFIVEEVPPGILP